MAVVSSTRFPSPPRIMQMVTPTELEVAIQLADGRARALRLPGTGPAWLGRDPACHVVLDSPTVSRRHLAVERVEAGLLLQDASNNGTRLGDEVIRQESRVVPEGTLIHIGPYTIRLGQPPSAEVASAPFSQVSQGPTAPGKAQVLTPPAGVPALSPATLPPAPTTQAASTSEVPLDVRRFMHRRLLDSLELDQLPLNRAEGEALRSKVVAALRRITAELAHQLPNGAALEQLIKELTDESLGLGPLEDLLANPDVSEIMVVDPQTIFAEIGGRLQLTPYRFTDAERVRAAIERIVTPLGRRIDESSPVVDARLADGSRVNAIIPPLALKGPCITIRKFPRDRLTLARLIEFGSLTERMATFLRRAVMARKNIVISGGTGSGKTTLLNVLSEAIPEGERIVTIEDAAELQLKQTHVVSLESRPPNMEGKGAYSIRDLVKNALRMRPDRIIVGECRGGEALDMLQAMNTGHDGSMTTTHANSPREALTRLEVLALMSGLDIPVRALRTQIASSVDLIVQQTRFSDGSRRVTSISEVTHVNHEGDIECHEVFGFHRTGTDATGRILGEFRFSGYIPTFIEQFIACGLAQEGDYL